MSRKPHATARIAQPPEAAAADNGRDRSDFIYREMHRALMEQRLAPGMRLPEEHVAEIYGVSRTLVRQALQRLAHDHLVVLELNRGARVAEPSVAEVRHLYEVRRLIECAALANPSFKLTRARLTELRRLVSREERANVDGNMQLSMQLSGQFHIELLQAMANPVLTDLLRELIARGNVAIALYEMRGRASCRCDDHRSIVQGLAAGDFASTIGVMDRHLSEIETSLTLRRRPRASLELRNALLSDARLVGTAQA